MTAVPGVPVEAVLVEFALAAGLEACGVEIDELGDANRETNLRFTSAVLAAALPSLREVIAIEVLHAVRQVHPSIGQYRTAQSAIGDLDREHIDVLAVGGILSDLQSHVIRAYDDAVRAVLSAPVQAAEATS